MCRIITTSELQQRTEQELSVLFRKASEQLAQSEPGSHKHRSAVANLENIARAECASFHDVQAAWLLRTNLPITSRSRQRGRYSC